MLPLAMCMYSEEHANRKSLKMDRVSLCLLSDLNLETKTSRIDSAYIARLRASYLSNQITMKKNVAIGFLGSQLTLGGKDVAGWGSAVQALSLFQ